MMGELAMEGREREQRKGSFGSRVEFVGSWDYMKLQRWGRLLVCGGQPTQRKGQEQGGEEPQQLCTSGSVGDLGPTNGTWGRGLNVRRQSARLGRDRTGKDR